MGYSTDFTIAVDADEGSDGPALLDILDRRLGESWGLERVSDDGDLDDERLNFSGKFYELAKHMTEATRGLAGTFRVTGVGEEAYVAADSAHDGEDHSDIWRQFFRDGVAGLKNEANIHLQDDPDVVHCPVSPEARVAVERDELRRRALSGDEHALDSLLA